MCVCVRVCVWGGGGGERGSSLGWGLNFLASVFDIF